MASWNSWRSQGQSTHTPPHGVPMPPFDIYSQRLYCLRNGHALYEPDPKLMYDVVRVGDVGHITEGFFHRAFNIFRTAEDPVNSRGVPEYFERCPSDETYTKTDLAPGVMYSTHVRTVGVEGSLQLSDPGTFIQAGVTVNLQCTGKQGAAIMIKYPAKREDAVRERDLGKYMLENYQTWLPFLRNNLGREVRLCDLILVTGCDLTDDWATATFVDESKDTSIGFTVGSSSITMAQASLSNSTQSTVHVPFRRGPNFSSRKGPRPMFNQCIFIRSFRVKERPIWKPRLMKGSAGPSKWDGYGDSDFSPPPETALPGRPAGIFGSESDDELIIDRTKTIHEMVLNILLKKTGANVALVHDHDMPLILTPGTLDAKDQEEFLAANFPSCVKVDEKGLGISIGIFRTSVYSIFAGDRWRGAAKLNIADVAHEKVRKGLTPMLSMPAPKLRRYRDLQYPPISRSKPKETASVPSVDKDIAPWLADHPTSSSPSLGLHLMGDRAQLHVQLFQARSLVICRPDARPYAIIQYAGQEFIGGQTVSFAGANLGQGNLSENSIPQYYSTIRKATRQNEAMVPKLNEEHSEDHADRSNPFWGIELSFDVVADATLSIYIYGRAALDEIFLGMVNIKPVYEHLHTTEQWYELQSFEEYGNIGKIRVAVTYKRTKDQPPLTIDSFEILKVVGRGSCDPVLQARKTDNGRIYAIKVVSGKDILANKGDIDETVARKAVIELKTNHLGRVQNCPFVTKSAFAFRTDTYLYFVTGFMTGGDLHYYMQQHGRLPEDHARFYVAEIVLALEHLHKSQIAYRGLRPENVLMDAIGHISLGNFSVSKSSLKSDGLKPRDMEYISPEVLLDNDISPLAVDFWSLGVILFEMICARSPFYAEDDEHMCKNVCFGKIRFPVGIASDTCKQLTTMLLTRNPKLRLGAQRDTLELKEHPFFVSLNWQALLLKQIMPPFKPSVESDKSVSNFEPGITCSRIPEIGKEALSQNWMSKPLGIIQPTAQQLRTHQQRFSYLDRPT